jgi:hypothetical protein
MCCVCDIVNSNSEGRRVMERRGVMEGGSKDETKRRREWMYIPLYCPL